MVKKPTKIAVWHGFLEAGQRSSAVLKDPSLDTSNPATVYLFNLERGRILEYRRDIVEPKLRELQRNEKALAKQLDQAFALVRPDFTPRAALRARIMASPPRKPKPVEPDLDDLEAWPLIPDIDIDPSEAGALG